MLSTAGQNEPLPVPTLAVELGLHKSTLEAAIRRGMVARALACAHLSRLDVRLRLPG